MNKKWYSYFVVSDDTAKPSTTGDGPTAPTRAGDLVPEPSAADGALPASMAAVPRSADLTVVYESAKITVPAHGYTVLKVADMLRSEHIRALPPEVRAKSVLVALDAAGVKVTEIVEDAVRRDRALDTYERVLQQHANDLAAATAAENRKIEEEITARIAELKTRIDENTRALAAEQADLQAWQARKQQEEALIAEAVGPFVSENPITTGPRSAAPQGDADVR